MKLSQISAALLKQAIQIYLEVAYRTPEGRRKHWPAIGLDESPSVDQMLSRFTDESHYTEDALSQRYILRLGNERYPHMKFVVEEFVIPNEYYIAVDTHDQLPVREDDPEYALWQELREFNRQVKKEIEDRWTQENLPTLHVVRASINKEMMPTSRKQISVLVVDDEPEMGETTKLMLEADGYQAKWVRDGQEALDAIAADSPDLVLLDIEMPGMDGYEVCRRIRRNPQTRELPILLATSGPGEMIYTLDADGFLAKPFHRDILLTFVSHVLQSRQRKST